MKKMTLTLLFVGALMALASCNKENNDIQARKATKSIELKIAGLTTPMNRAIGDETDAAYAATLSSATVIFYNGNTVYDKFVTGAEFTIDNLEAGHIFHGINKEATDVMVVGNQAVTGTTISGIKAQTVAIANEQGDAVTLIGATALGEGEEVYHPTDGNDIVTLVKASVEIAPLVARFEIKSIGCSDLGTNYQDLTLNTIGLINFAENVTLGGAISGPIMKLGKYSGDDGYSGNIFPIVKPAGIADTYVWYQFGKNATWSWSYETLTAQLTADENSVTAGENKVWAFNFIPEGTTNIMLQLEGDSFIRTSGFTGAGAAGFEAGKIYQLGYTFKEENLGVFDKDAIVCAEVTVNVKKWDIVTIAPTFE